MYEIAAASARASSNKTKRDDPTAVDTRKGQGALHAQQSVTSPQQKQKKQNGSPAGNRTRASRVRVSYPNQLDYGGRSWVTRIALRYDAEVVI